MKNFTLILAMLAVAAGAQGRPSLPKAKFVRTPVKVAARAVAENAAQRWQPAKVNTFMYSPDEDLWIPLDIFEYTYNGNGKVTVEAIEDLENESKGITTYTYDPQNRLIEKLSKVDGDGEGFVNSERETYAYDPVVASLVVDHTGDMWIDNEWQPVSNNYRREVTRDNAGNITEVKLSVLFQGNYDNTQTITTTYGADGKAKSIVSKELQYDGEKYYWDEVLSFTDIVWHSTDGQICQVEDLTVGPNRIASATRTESGDISYQVQITYTNDDYTAVYTADGFNMTEVYTVLDNNGSYKLSRTATEETGDESWTTSTTYTFKQDAWGNLLLEEYVDDYGDGDIQTERITGEVTNGPDGLPAEHITSIYYSDSEGEDGPTPELKTVFDSYVDIAGADDATIAAPAAEAEYFNLQGMRVHGSLAPGIYIKRQGTDTSKVLIK